VTARKGAGPGPAQRAQRSVQSIEVGGPLLLALASAPTPMTLKDLAAAAALPASRAHPYLVSFGRLGLVTQDGTSGRYALGPAAMQIGLTCLFQSDPLRAGTDVAQALAAQTGHAVALAVWGNFGPTVVRLFEARQALHITLRAGTVMSVYGTATGRAFVAALPTHRVDQVLHGPQGALPPFGLHGTRPASPAQRQREDAAIAAEYRNHQLVRVVGTPLPGVNAFSAPILDHEGQVALVITVLDAQEMLSPSWTGAGAQALRAAAAEIAARLGAGALRAGQNPAKTALPARPA
jgi:DNA-binding IclR family transcriptional regulator